MAETNKFVNGIVKEIDSELTTTDNGALAYKTAGGEGKHIVDFNFAVSTMRSWDEEKIRDFFAKVYFENRTLAARYWAFCADCRGGLGERRLSRIIFKWFIDNDIDVARSLLKFIPEFGRWDSVAMLADSAIGDDAVELIDSQLKDDIIKCREGKSFSLCAKWLPSANTSSSESRRIAALITKKLDITPRQYRRMLSELRAGLKVIESKMSANKWGEIDYNAVPSKANILYKGAFLKHDADRRRQYLEDLKSNKKDVKINSSVSFPCDIVHSYCNDNYWYHDCTKGYDEALEQMWKALPNYVTDKSNNVLVVADTSGSMMTPCSGASSLSAWQVAQSLAIYFSERATGPFKDKYIMFSANPFWVDFSKCHSLHDRLVLSQSYNECSNTNIAKTMKLILDTAVNNHLTQDELPKTLVILSDMIFNPCYEYDESLMDSVAREFKDAGYSLPKIVYWCISGAGNGHTVPMQTNDKGMILLSGFSATLMSMALSGEISPYKALLEKLNSSRYDAVEKALDK